MLLVHHAAAGHGAVHHGREDVPLPQEGLQKGWVQRSCSFSWQELCCWVQLGTQCNPILMLCNTARAPPSAWLQQLFAARATGALSRCQREGDDHNVCCVSAAKQAGMRGACRSRAQSACSCSCPGVTPGAAPARMSSSCRTQTGCMSPAPSTWGARAPATPRCTRGKAVTSRLVGLWRVWGFAVLVGQVSSVYTTSGILVAGFATACSAHCGTLRPAPLEDWRSHAGTQVYRSLYGVIGIQLVCKDTSIACDGAGTLAASDQWSSVVHPAAGALHSAGAQTC